LRLFLVALGVILFIGSYIHGYTSAKADLYDVLDYMEEHRLRMRVMDAELKMHEERHW